MKRNLDQNFKEAFENYELPYNASSWEALNKKLDSMQTPPKTGGNSNFKWFAGSAIAILTIGAVWLGIPSNSESKTQLSTNEVTQQTEELTVVDKKNTAATNSISQKEEPISPNKVENTNTTQNVTTSQVKSTEETSNAYVNTSTETPSTNPKEVTPNEVVTSKIPNQSNETQDVSILLPSFDEIICENSTKVIENKNKSELALIDPKGKKTIIEKNSKKSFNLNQAGTYTLESVQNPASKTKFNVKEAPTADFIIQEEFVYENGIPTTIVEAIGSAQNYSWSFGKNTVKSSEKVAFGHFYKKGNYPIQLIQTGKDGCVSKVEKEIYIAEDYNLLAPTGFMPLSSDVRKNKFIPIALQIRDVQFKMIIIEPRSGNVIFETSSTEGWDGIDKNTKQLVEVNNSYIWKVFISNPEKGESNEYSGVVTRL